MRPWNTRTDSLMGPVPGPLHWLPGVLTSEQPASPGARAPGGRVSEQGGHRCCPAFRSHTATSSCQWSAPAAPGQRGGDCSGWGAPGGRAPGHLAADPPGKLPDTSVPQCPPPHRTGVLDPSRESSGGGRHVLRSPVLSVNSSDVQKHVPWRLCTPPLPFRHLKTLSFRLHGSELLRQDGDLPPPQHAHTHPSRRPLQPPGWEGVPGSP